jgi:hypothetical protein
MNIVKLISQLQSRIDKNSERIRFEEEDISELKANALPIDEGDTYILKHLREKQTLDKRLLGALMQQRKGAQRCDTAHIDRVNNQDVGVDFL